VDVNERDPRVHLAAERTLLAWLRTGIALMGFGFVVARFGVFLRELAPLAHAPATRQTHAEVIGVVLVAAGVGLNVWASIRHTRMLRQFSETGRIDVMPRGPVAVGIGSGIVGALLVALLLLAVRW
jgi:putative membrane protein